MLFFWPTVTGVGLNLRVSFANATIPIKGGNAWDKNVKAWARPLFHCLMLV